MIIFLNRIYILVCSVQNIPQRCIISLLLYWKLRVLIAFLPLLSRIILVFLFSSESEPVFIWWLVWAVASVRGHTISVVSFQYQGRSVVSSSPICRSTSSFLTLFIFEIHVKTTFVKHPSLWSLFASSYFVQVSIFRLRKLGCFLLGCHIRCILVVC